MNRALSTRARAIRLGCATMILLAGCAQEIDPPLEAADDGGGLITIGESQILPVADSGNGRLLVAQQATLPRAATIQSLSFYVTANPDGGTLLLGLYDASPGGGPGTRRAQTASFRPVVGWNRVDVVTPVSLAAGSYWLAYLPSSDGLAFVKAGISNGAPSSVSSFLGVTGPLPSTFPSSSTPTTSHWSFYATLTEEPPAPTGSCASDAACPAGSFCGDGVCVSAGIDLPGRIQAEAYRAGGSGVGYSDTTAGNAGGAYRKDAVDLQSTSDAGGGYNVGWTAGGEWLAYPVKVATTGAYDLTARVAGLSAATMHFEVDGASVGTMSVPSTGGWQSWTNVTATGVTLSAGAHTLEVHWDSSGTYLNNLNYLDVTASGSPTGATLYVDGGSLGGTCSDSRSATQVAIATPWCTLGRAIAAAPSGSTVYVRGGTYPGLSDSGGTARTDFVTLAAYPSETVTVSTSFTISNASYLRVKGFRFRGVSNNQIGPDSSHIEIRDSDVYGGGFFVTSGSTNVVLQNNKIHDFTNAVAGPTRGGTPTGIFLAGSPSPIQFITIRGNEIYDGNHDGIDLWYDVWDATIEYNHIHDVVAVDGDHVDAIQSCGSAGCGSGTKKNLTLRGNFIHDIDQEGVLIKDGPVQNLIVEDNIIFTHGSWDLYIFDTTGGVIRNNTIDAMNFSKGNSNLRLFDNIFRLVSVLDGGTMAQFSAYGYNVVTPNVGYTPASTDIVAAPTFVNPARLDYRLAAGSRGIDAAHAGEAARVNQQMRGRIDDPAVPDTGAGTPSYGDCGALERVP